MTEVAVELAKKQLPTENKLKKRLRTYRGKFRSAIEQVFVEESDNVANLSDIFTDLTSKNKSKYVRTVATDRYPVN